MVNTKKALKILLIIFTSVTIITIPLTINILFKYDFGIWWLQSEWSAGDALNFYAGMLSFAGTITLGIISLQQTNKASKISRKLLDKELISSTDFIQIQNKFDISVKNNSDTKITMSTHHKADYGAIILVEPTYEGNKEASKYNEYLIKIYFKNSSAKNNIEKIELDHFTCVQDPEHGGLCWENGSNDPIPLLFHTFYIKKAYLNWISNDEFCIQFKVYCEPKKMFDSMIKNKANLCFLMYMDIYSFSGVMTKMEYKLWISKEKKATYKVINSNSTIKENKIIKNNL